VSEGGGQWSGLSFGFVEGAAAVLSPR
jgi:hypothetical protein